MHFVDRLNISEVLGKDLLLNIMVTGGAVMVASTAEMVVFAVVDAVTVTRLTDLERYEVEAGISTQNARRQLSAL